MELQILKEFLPSAEPPPIWHILKTTSSLYIESCLKLSQESEQIHFAFIEDGIFIYIKFGVQKDVIYEGDILQGLKIDFKTFFLDLFRKI